jgi:hypothetical protein
MQAKLSCLAVLVHVPPISPVPHLPRWRAPALIEEAFEYKDSFW